MARLATREFAAGSTFWCVFHGKFSAASFNPNVGGDPACETTGGRFNPFDGSDGARVPTKYLADHPNGAFAETLLRDDREPREVSRASVENYRVAQLAFRRSLLLCDLAETRSSTLSRMLRSGSDAYPALRDVAATLHARHPDFAGMSWEGRQLDLPGMNCLVLFGDRVTPEDFTPIAEHALSDGAGLRLLRAAARLRGFGLPKGYAGA